MNNWFLKKKKISKQPEQEQNHRRSFGGLSAGRGKGKIGGKGAGIKKHNL